MSDGLRDRFGAEVEVLRPGQLTSPATMLTASAKELARPGDPLLLVVTCVLTRFARKAGDLWAVVLPGSIPGRPKSTLRLESLVETAARVAAQRPLLVGLDAAVQEDETAARGFAAVELAMRLASACRTLFRWSPSIVVRASSVERRASSVERRASSVERRASSVERRASSDR